MKHGVPLFCLLFTLLGAACEPWNLEPRTFPDCTAPTARIGTTTNLLTVKFELLNLTGTADGILWNFGDGTTSTVFGINHTYPRPGTYPVTARVTNICGDELLLTATVTVNQATLPLVTTLTPTEFTATSARVGVTVNSLGNDVISAYGVLLSATQAVPTLANTNPPTYPGSGQPTANTPNTLTARGLQRGRTYYVRGYATNSAGTGYGEVKSFVL